MFTIFRVCMVWALLVTSQVSNACLIFARAPSTSASYRSQVLFDSRLVLVTELLQVAMLYLPRNLTPGYTQEFTEILRGRINPVAVFERRDGRPQAETLAVNLLKMAGVPNPLVSVMEDSLSELFYTADQFSLGNLLDRIAQIERVVGTQNHWTPSFHQTIRNHPLDELFDIVVSGVRFSVRVTQHSQINLKGKRHIEIAEIYNTPYLPEILVVNAVERLTQFAQGGSEFDSISFESVDQTMLKIQLGLNGYQTFRTISEGRKPIKEEPNDELALASDDRPDTETDEFNLLSDLPWQEGGGSPSVETKFGWEKHDQNRFPLDEDGYPILPSWASLKEPDPDSSFILIIERQAIEP